MMGCWGYSSGCDCDDCLYLDAEEEARRQRELDDCEDDLAYWKMIEDDEFWSDSY
jgi:hypothetical protein